MQLSGNHRSVLSLEDPQLKAATPNEFSPRLKQMPISLYKDSRHTISVASRAAPAKDQGQSVFAVNSQAPPVVESSLVQKQKFSRDTKKLL